MSDNHDEQVDEQGDEMAKYEMITDDPKIRCDVSWVKEYDFNNLPENFAVLLASERRAGKTHLTKFFLNYVKDRFDHAYLFSETADLQLDAYDFIPEKNRHASYNYEVINQIVEGQETNKKYNNKLPESERRYQKILIILDDVIADESVRRGPGVKVLNRLFSRGRHSNISIVCIAQMISTRYGFSGTVRENCDIAIGFMIQNQYSREAFAECYLSIESKKKGMILLNSVTCVEEGYTAIVCDKSVPNKTCYKDYVFKIRAPEKLPNYVIGKEQPTKIYTDTNWNVQNVPRPKNSLEPGIRSYQFMNPLKPGQRRLNLVNIK